MIKSQLGFLKLYTAMRKIENGKIGQNFIGNIRTIDALIILLATEEWTSNTTPSTKLYGN